MCGFAVAIYPGATDSVDRAEKGTDEPTGSEVIDRHAVETALTGRGPDGIGWLTRADLVMAAARLVHWEEGSAAQPYEAPDGRVGVFNGELFNLRDLQVRLGLPGASEIEVLVTGLIQEGPSFLDLVDGQFAAVVSAGVRGQYLAVRDRFGICPLYFASTAHGVVLASNLAALQACDPGLRRLSPGGLREILTAWAPSRGLTAYEGVAQVLPGGVVEIRDGAVVSSGVWAPVSPAPDAGAAPGGETDSVTERLESALRASVASRLRSPTPVACLISGGIDSTIVSALASEAGASLGIGLVVEGQEEVRARQRQVADAVGLPLLQHVLTPEECLSVLVDYVGTRRVPLVRLGPVGMTALARRARREGVRAVLSGEGADELFAGYDSYRVLAARAGLLGPPQSLDWAAFGLPEFDAHRGERWARAYWRTLVGFGGSSMSRADILGPVAPLLAPILLPGDGEEEGPEARRGGTRPDDTRLDDTRPDDARPGVADPLLARREEDLRDLLGAYLLTVQGDHAWMEEGVELRPPYLSRDVAEIALTRPPADFVSISTGKTPVRGVLRRLAEPRPALSALDFAKAAFRVDARLLLGDPGVGRDFVDLVASCPADWVDPDALRTRAERCLEAGTCSEAESMLFTFAASLGVLQSHA